MSMGWVRGWVWETHVFRSEAPYRVPYFPVTPTFFVRLVCGLETVSGVFGREGVWVIKDEGWAGRSSAASVCRMIHSTRPFSSSLLPSP